MKPTRPILAPWLLSAILAGVLHLPQAHAVDRTWNGGGTDNFWNTPNNWGGTKPSASDSLVFSGTTRLNAVNDYAAATGFTNITFNKDAGSFVLSGNSITLNGNVTDDSQNTQTISLAMVLSNSRTFTVNGGELVLSGAISESGGARTLTKEGLGTLTFTGTSTYSGDTRINAGTVKLELNAGGKLNAATPISFGLSTNYFTANKGTFEIKGVTGGSASVTTGTLRMFTHGAANVVVGGSTALTASSFFRAGSGTLNFDLSAAGSSMAFTTAPTMVNGILRYATVTDTSGTTGFVAIDGSNRVTRYVPTESLKTTGNDSTINYRTSGTTSLVNTQQGVNSLTITGGGEINSVSGSISTYAILMQEGAGDFTIKSTTGVRAPAAGSLGLTIHQYSTTGVFTIEGVIAPSGPIIKAGPGKVRLSGTSTYTGATYVQGGELQMDGALTSSSNIIVYDGATFSGKGSVGTSASSTVLIRSGGTIRGDQDGALKMTGSLTLESDSHFAMTLGSAGSGTVQVTGAVALGGADLVLSLDSVPILNQEFTILSGTISGTFSTINGTAFGPDQSFNLNYNSISYGFQLFYGANNVTLQMISVPEPGTSALLAIVGGGATLALYRRKRRSTR